MPTPGGPYILFDGAIRGEYVEVEAGKRIVLTWRSSSWPEGHHSRVEMTLSEPKEGTTVLALKQTGIPIKDNFGHETVMEVTEVGWKERIFTRIRQVFGFVA